MEKYQEAFILNKKSIDDTALKVYEYLTDAKYSKEAVISSRIAVETILNEWMENGAQDKRFELRIKKSFGRLHVYLLLEGEMLKFTDTAQNNDFLNILEKNLSATFSVGYSSGTNIADIVLPRQKLGSLGKIILAFVLACVLGNILPLIFSADSLADFSKDYISPAISAIIGILGGFAAIQIFFSILDSILNMGNVTVFRNTGSKYMKLVLVTTIMTTVIGSIIMLTICPIISMEGGGAAGNINTIYQIIIDIIPTNVLKPFLDGNMLQIVFLGAFLGTIILVFKNEITGLSTGITSINRIFMHAVIILSRLMPIFVFLSILSFFLKNQVKLVLDSWLLLVVHALCCLASALVMLVIAAFYSKTNLFGLFKRILPIFGIGFSTASTIMTIPTIKKVLEDLNVNENTSKFSINLGYVFSRQTTCLVTMSIVTCYYSILGKTLTPGDFVMLAFVSMVLAVAAPSVPGGGAAIIAGLMAAYGLPTEIVAVVLSLDYLMDMTTTGTGCVCMTAEGLMLNRLVRQSD